MSSQPPYDPYGYYRPPAGPPQPQWQAPPAGSARPAWHDPRQQSSSESHSPQQPPYHTFNGYNHPPPSAPHLPHRPPAQDTSGWGVKYNHSSEPLSRLDPLPPLPPRPPSTNARPEPHEAHQQPRPSGRWQDPRPESSAWHTPSYARPESHTQAQTPPAPPPRPPQYQQQPQYYDTNAFPHEQYTQRPSTSHRYEPQHQNSWQNKTTPQPVSPPQSYVPSRTPAPYVSPVESQVGPWSSQNTAQYVAQQATASASSEPPSSSSQTTFSNHNNTNFGGAAAIDSQAAWQGHPSSWEHLTPTASKADLSEQFNAHQSPAVFTEPQHDAERDHRQPSATSGPLAGAWLSATPGIGGGNKPDETRPALKSRVSTDTDTTLAGIQRTGTIDSVINAWSTPIDLPDTTFNNRLSRSPSAQSSISVAERGRKQHDELNAASVPTTASHLMQSTSSTPVPSDPYADLDPELRASLARYQTMLRKEASASSDGEKYKIFESFVKKELRLRAVMYDVESDRTTTGPVLSGDHSQAALMLQPISAPAKSNFDQGVVVEQPEATSITDGKVQPMPESLKKEQVLTPPPIFASKAIDSPASNDDSFVVVDRHEDDLQYSPGGRPKIATRREPSRDTQRPLPSVATTAFAAEVERQAYSPSDDAPQVVSLDYVTPGPASPPKVPAFTNLADSDRSKTDSSQSQLPPTIRFEPERPVYTPFRYQEMPPRMGGPDGRGLSAEEAYASLRKEYADSDRLMAQNTATTPKQHHTFVANANANANTGNENAETFLGLIREHSRLYRKGSPAVDALRQRAGTPRSGQSPIADAVLALCNMLPPKPDTEDFRNQKLNELQEMVQNFSNDFSFIKETVIKWDRANREIRVGQDAERHERLADLEAENNSRFEAKEITYSQVSAFEADFQLEEAERKYKEDREELASFTTVVFTSVTERLQRAISELNIQYIRATDLLDLESDAASRVMWRENGKAAMAPTMEVVLSLFNMLEIRHKKVAEAHFELEKRRKQLEKGVLTTNDDTAGLEKVEKDFATAQKLQILHEAQENDRRANQLVDLFDRATVRGLGDNQTFTDDVVSRIVKLKDAIFHDDDRLLQNLYGENGARQTLTAAHAVLDLVLADSRAILTTSNTADTILNDADYRLSVAEAHVARADPSTYQNLQSEKAKEDAKLLEEQDMRLRSIADAPAEGVSVIKEVVAQIGDDPDHHERIQRALENAKRRNMDKASAAE